MKKTFLPWIVLSAVTLMMLFSSCKPAPSTPSDPFDPPDFTPTKAPSDWMEVGSYVSKAVQILPVALDKIPARHVALPENQSAELVMALSDGGCIAVSQAPVDAKEKSSSPMYFLRAIRFKADGSMMWDKLYKEDPFQGYVQKLCIFADDEFAVSLQVQLNNSTLYSAVSRLCRFSSEGGLLWRTMDDQMTPGALDYIFATKDGSVLAAGMLQVLNTDGSVGDNDIGLLRFEKDGTVSKRLTVGTPKNDSLMDAVYSPETGLVLSWRKELDGSSVISGMAVNQESQMDCYGEDLKNRWTSVMAPTDILFDMVALPGDGSVLVSGTMIKPTADLTATTSRSALYCFDKNGARPWIYTISEEKAWITAAAGLADGRFVAGWFQNTDKSGERSNLAILSPEGTLIKSLEPIPGIVQQLVSTKDGGFTVVLRQTVAPLPQPPYISSMWTDTEAVIAHFDSGLNLVWRRSIDQYKHALRSDIVVPTIEDHLLVG